MSEPNRSASREFVRRLEAMDLAHRDLRVSARLQGPVCEARISTTTAISVASATSTQITWASAVQWAEWPLWTSGSTAKNLVVPQGWSGWWTINLNFVWDLSALGTRRITSIYSGSSTLESNLIARSEVAPSSGHYPTGSLSTEVLLVEGDTITVEVYQDSGIALQWGGRPGAGNFGLRYQGRIVMRWQSQP